MLARPNGLAGWRLPTVGVDGVRTRAEDWTDDELSRATAVAGGSVEPAARIDADVWEFRSVGRIGAAGTTWITVTDAERFGSDAVVVRRWAATAPR